MAYDQNVSGCQGEGGEARVSGASFPDVANVLQFGFSLLEWLTPFELLPKLFSSFELELPRPSMILVLATKSTRKYVQRLLHHNSQRLATMRPLLGKSGLFAAATTTLFRNNSPTSLAMSVSVGTQTRVGIDYPELVVFDLDACFWDQEMFEMSSLPDRTVSGDLYGKGEGVIGAYSGGNKISMHPGSLIALQEHAEGKLYPGMKVCFASSADTPFAEKVGRATLKLLEVVPGLTVWDLVLRDWENRDVSQIGRQPPLSSNKAQSHFPRIREITGITYDKMLFFDDCNWGDHCGMVARACKENGKSVVTHRTPSGLREADWRTGLELYRKAHAGDRLEL